MLMKRNCYFVYERLYYDILDDDCHMRYLYDWGWGHNIFKKKR